MPRRLHYRTLLADEPVYRIHWQMTGTKEARGPRVSGVKWSAEGHNIRFYENHTLHTIYETLVLD